MEHEANFLDLLIVFGENLRLLILLPIMAGLISLGLTYFMEPVFTAETVFLPPVDEGGSSITGDLAGLAALAGVRDANTNNAEQVVSLLKSTTLLDRMVDLHDLKIYFKSELNKQARDNLSSRTKIKVENDGLITLKYTGPDPLFAAEIANSYVSQLKILTSEFAFSEAQRRRKFLELKYEETKIEVSNALAKLKNSGLDIELFRVYPELAMGSIANLREKIAEKEIEIKSSETYLAANSIGMKTSRSELVALKQQLRLLLNSEKSDRANKDDYSNLYRDYKAQEELLKFYFKEFERARIDESREGRFIQVVDPAQPPEVRSSPKRKIIAIYTSLVSGFAVSFILLIKFFFIVDKARGGGLDVKTARLKGAIREQLFLR